MGGNQICGCFSRFVCSQEVPDFCAPMPMKSGYMSFCRYARVGETVPVSQPAAFRPAVRRPENASAATIVGVNLAQKQYQHGNRQARVESCKPLDDEAPI